VSNKHEVEQMVTYAISQGWTVTRTKSYHLKWRSPAGQLVVTSSTPSDRRAITAMKVWLRRYGLEFPIDKHRKKKP
jgi:hypothetical protein